MIFRLKLWILPYYGKIFNIKLKVNKIATDPRRPTQTSSLADPAEEEGVIASQY
jgi:hypothetical protein